MCSFLQQWLCFVTTIVECVVFAAGERETSYLACMVSIDGLLRQDILMLNFFPEITEADRSSKHEFIFVIDRSGLHNLAKIKSWI